MGDLFGIQLKVVNRYGGFQALRYKWRQYIESTLLRAVLLIDESQDMPAMALSELRSLISDEFDSKRILTVVLAGDMRLSERLKADELLANAMASEKNQIDEAGFFQTFQIKTPGNSKMPKEKKNR